MQVLGDPLIKDGSQRKCFSSPLQLQELEGIKETVRREYGESGVRDGGLTESGFLYLHTMFIRRGRLETTWTVLRTFGYAEDLKLTEAFLSPKYATHLLIDLPGSIAYLSHAESRFDVPHDCSVELSPLGYQFFTELFQFFDKVRGGFALFGVHNCTFVPHCRTRTAR